MFGEIYVTLLSVGCFALILLFYSIDNRRLSRN